jgi:hypothetical protein
MRPVTDRARHRQRLEWIDQFAGQVQLWRAPKFRLQARICSRWALVALHFGRQIPDTTVHTKFHWSIAHVPGVANRVSGIVDIAAQGIPACARCRRHPLSMQGVVLEATACEILRTSSLSHPWPRNATYVYHMCIQFRPDDHVEHTRMISMVLRANAGVQACPSLTRLQAPEQHDRGRRGEVLIRMMMIIITDWRLASKVTSLPFKLCQSKYA